MNGRLHNFACPVCGQVRAVSARALAAIERGQRSGECHNGEGCRQRLTEPERLRRWWLELCGVPEPEIRRAGGAVPFVLEFGMPDLPRRARGRETVEPLVAARVRSGRGGDARSKLPAWCFDQADGDPELALALAVEIIRRGVPVHTLVTVDVEVAHAA